MCDEGKQFARVSWIAGISTGVLALTAGYFGYRAFFRDNNTEAAPAKEPEQAVRIEPYVGPDGFGAGMTVRF